jgi:hypothetical protein
LTVRSRPLYWYLWEGIGAVAHAWMPEAMRIRAETDGGALGGGAPRVVWLTLGSLANAVSVQSAAERLVAEHRPCHLVWNPATGEIAQLISVLRAGRALGAPDRLDWTPVRIHRRPENVNAEGRVCVQIGVLALAAEPFTNGPMIGVDAIMSWLDSWGVPRRWPGGQPGGWTDGGRAGGRAGVVGGTGGGAVGGGGTGGGGTGGGVGGTDGSRAVWARGGHFGASQVPGCAHVGPGAIDIHRLTGSGPHGLAVRTRELPSPFAAALPIPA